MHVDRDMEVGANRIVKGRRVIVVVESMASCVGVVLASGGGRHVGRSVQGCKGGMASAQQRAER